jgi:hypothetical protein
MLRPADQHMGADQLAPVRSLRPRNMVAGVIRGTWPCQTHQLNKCSGREGPRFWTDRSVAENYL